MSEDLFKFLAASTHGGAFSETWAKDNIIIPESESRVSGAFNPHYNPAISRLVSTFYGSSHARELYLEKSSQCGGTMTCMMAMVHQRVSIGGNAIIFSDSQSQSRTLGRRFENIINASFPDKFAYRNKHDRNQSEKRFLDGLVWILGSGSAGSLASKAAIYILIDEIDKHRQIKDEATSVGLARQRCKTFPNSKLVAISTPTSARGQIHQLYSTADVIIDFKTKCPHCKDTIIAHQIIDISTSSICCPSCKAPISNTQRVKMINKGKWDPIKKHQRIGARFSDILHPAIHQDVLLSEWAKCNTTLSRREFFQNRLGSPYDQSIEQQAMADTLAAQLSSQDNVDEGGYKVMAIDSQYGTYKWVISSYPVDHQYEIIVHKYGEEDSLEAAIAIGMQDAHIMLLDDGGRHTWQNRPKIKQHNALQDRNKSFKKIIPVKGFESLRSNARWMWSEHGFAVSGKGDVDRLPALLVGDSACKDEIVRIIDVDKTIRIPQPVDIKFLQELVAERAVNKQSKDGHMYSQYVANGKNDWFDCIKYGYAYVMLLRESGHGSKMDQIASSQ